MAEVGKVTYKITGDNSEFDKDIQKSKSIAQKAAGAIGGVLKGAGAIGVAAMAAAGKAALDLGKAVVSSYGDYEQLVGGIETLFGAGGKSIKEYADSVGKSVADVKDEYADLMAAQNAVMTKAKNAYKDAGLSANEYMNTAIGFSGALLKSLGGDTKEAARMTDMAIKDMADQANKYGKTVESVSETYMSLARGNTQTLDNLFGGMFAGTKAGLEEMLVYAEKYRAGLGETVSYSVDSYADIVSAIHDVSMSLGVYGTTSQEAAGTIQGSVNMMVASWKNLLTGLGDSKANVGELVKEFTGSLSTVINNITPIVEHTVSAVPTLVKSLLTAIQELAPNTILPVVSDLINQIFETIISLIPEIIPVATQLVGQLAQTLLENLPLCTDAILSIINGLVDFISQNAEMVGQSAVDVILALANGLIEMLPVLLPAVTGIILGIVKALCEPENIQNLIIAAIELCVALAAGLIMAIPQLLLAVGELIVGIVTAIVEKFPEFVEKGKELCARIKEGVSQRWADFVNSFKEKWESLKTKILSLAKKFTEIGQAITNGIKNGISAGWQKLKDWVGGLAKGLLDKAKSVLGIHSPSKAFEDEFGEEIPEGAALGVKKKTKVAMDAARDMAIKMLPEYSVSSNFSNLAMAGAGSSFGDINVYVDGSTTDPAGLGAQIVYEIQQQVRYRGASL